MRYVGNSINSNIALQILEKNLSIAPRYLNKLTEI